MYQIVYFTTKQGSQPVREFIDGLEPNMQAKAMRSILLLSEYGPQLREPYTKYVGDGLFELRFRFANDISRIFFFFVVNQTIVLTNGFIKKTRQTPKVELSKARSYQKEYMENYDE